MQQQLTNNIMHQIAMENSNNNLAAIPHSDEFIKNISSLYSVDAHTVITAINILKDSHKILSFEVMQEDKKNDIKRIEGYVEANLMTIKRLKTIFQNALMDEYELRFKRRLLVHQIIKEIYSNISMFKNTPMGQLANKAIMLEEYEYLIEKNYSEYTDEWKSKKYKELLEKPDLEAEEKKDSSEKAQEQEISVNMKSAQPQRAIDSNEFKDIPQAASPQSLKKMIQIYGVNFFFRVQLRKYNFNQLREIVESDIISKRDDLKLLKDMIKTVRSNFEKDSKLSEYTDDLNKLEQTVSHHILHSRR